MNPITISTRSVQFAAISAAILAFTASASDARANLLSNGSFESIGVTFGSDGAIDLPVGSTAITGWDIIDNHVAALTTPNNYGIIANNGNVSLDLQATSDTINFGGVQQTVATNIGGTYFITFSVGVINTPLSTNAPVTINVSATSIGHLPTAANFTNNSRAIGQSWLQFTLPFTAVGTSTTIAFVGTSTANGAYIGLDNVSLADPEPASLTFLAAAFPLLLKRRR